MDETDFDGKLMAWFDYSDLDRTKTITVKELHRALCLAGLNLDLSTSAMLVRMYDTEREGALGFEQFSSLQDFLMSVRNSFYQFDYNRTGEIDRDELLKALQLNNLPLDKGAFDAVFKSFDKHNRKSLDLAEYVSMAAFLSCAKHMSRKFDRQMRGHGTYDFSSFCLVLGFMR